MASRCYLVVAALISIGIGSADHVARAEASAGIAQLTGAESPLKPGMKIAFFGDSITMQGGYIQVIGEAIKQSSVTKDLGVQLLKHGLNGGRIPTILEGKSPWGSLGGTVQELLAKEKPDIVVIYAGVNDVWHGEKGTTKEDFAAGLKQMIEMSKAEGAAVVVATLAVIGEKPNGKSSQDKKLDEYAALTIEVAQENGATPVNLRAAFMEYLEANNTEKNDKGEIPSKGILTSDGVHMKGKGNALLADMIAAGIAVASSSAN